MNQIWELLRVSYKENWSVVEAGPHVLLDGTGEILPGISGIEVHGHTVGQQWIRVVGDAATLMFATDLIPTAHHLPLPYSMGYDVCTQTVLGEKEAFLKEALLPESIVVFQHDVATEACRVHIDERGHYAVKERISLT